MLKAPGNPNCENDFDNIEIEYLTLSCPSYKLQMTLLRADSKRNNENFFFFFGNKSAGENYIPNCKFYKNGECENKREKGKRVVCTEDSFTSVAVSGMLITCWSP